MKVKLVTICKCTRIINILGGNQVRIPFRYNGIKERIFKWDEDESKIIPEFHEVPDN